MGFQMSDDYVDVAERIRQFKEMYPEGTLQSWRDPYIVEAKSGQFVVYSAAAYRTPDDPRPGVGTAWEPVPGATSFTRQSELQNAETAAWGRAIIAVGIPSKHIASSEEVRNRRAEGQQQNGRQNAPRNDVDPSSGEMPPLVHDWLLDTGFLPQMKQQGVSGWNSTEVGIVLGRRPEKPTEASALLFEGGWGDEGVSPGRDRAGFLKRLHDEHKRLAAADEKRAAERV